MNRKLIILLVVIWIGIAFASFLAYRLVTRSSSFLTTVSPSETYTVSFSGNRNRPWLPIDHCVQYAVLKNGQPFLSERNLACGDWLDHSFDSAFPDHRWPNDKTLQLYRTQNHQDTPVDTIVIANITDREIKFVRLDSVDAVLLFDIAPRSVHQVTVAGPRSDNQSMFVSGEFVDGSCIAKQGGPTDVKDRARGSVFHITISDSGVSLDGSLGHPG